MSERLSIRHETQCTAKMYVCMYVCYSRKKQTTFQQKNISATVFINHFADENNFLYLSNYQKTEQTSQC